MGVALRAGELEVSADPQGLRDEDSTHHEALQVDLLDDAGLCDLLRGWAARVSAAARARGREGGRGGRTVGRELCVCWRRATWRRVSSSSLMSASSSSSSSSSSCASGSKSTSPLRSRGGVERGRGEAVRRRFEVELEWSLSLSACSESVCLAMASGAGLWSSRWREREMRTRSSSWTRARRVGLSLSHRLWPGCEDMWVCSWLLRLPYERV